MEPMAATAAQSTHPTPPAFRKPILPAAERCSDAACWHTPANASKACRPSSSPPAFSPSASSISNQRDDKGASTTYCALKQCSQKHVCFPIDLVTNVHLEEEVQRFCINLRHKRW